MTGLSKFGRAFLACRLGNVAMMFSLSIMGVFGVSALALDYSNALALRARIGVAADAAVLAGARKSASTEVLRVQTARAMFDSAMQNEKQFDLVSFTAHDVTEAGSVTGFRIEVQAQVKTTLGLIFGKEYLPITVVTQSEMERNPYVEMVMVLDTTGSMAGAKLDSAKSAAHMMIKTLRASSRNPSRVRIGLVPFSTHVNVGTSRLGASWLAAPAPAGLTWNGCVGSRVYPLNIADGDYVTPVPAIAGAVCGAEISPLTSDVDTIEARIDAMTATGNTYIPSGLIWGWRLLSPGAPFDETMTGKTSDSVRRSLLLMTDGQNTVSPTYPDHDGVDTVVSNNLVVELCNAIKNDGRGPSIRVDTIAFEVTDPTIKNILRDCAGNGGQFFEASDGAQLTAAFQTIGRSVVELRITR